MARVKVEGIKYELRYYSNPHRYEVVGTYDNPQLAFGMKKQKNALYPQTYPLSKLRVVPV